LLCDWALVDPAGGPAGSGDGLQALLRAQLALDADAIAPMAAWAPAPVPQPAALGAAWVPERPAARPTLR
jgi:hypothetical protein